MYFIEYHLIRFGELEDQYGGEAKKNGQKIRVTVELHGGKFVFSIVVLWWAASSIFLVGNHRLITVNFGYAMIFKRHGTVPCLPLYKRLLAYFRIYDINKQAKIKLGIQNRYPVNKIPCMITPF